MRRSGFSSVVVGAEETDRQNHPPFLIHRAEYRFLSAAGRCKSDAKVV